MDKYAMTDPSGFSRYFRERVVLTAAAETKLVGGAGPNTPPSLPPHGPFTPHGPLLFPPGYPNT
jgi:hypothetical protein